MRQRHESDALRFAIRAILHPLAACLVANAAAAQAVKTTIAPSGLTQTTASKTGNVTTVSGGSVVGAVAYNSFTTFTEQKGDTVNLMLPTGTSSLLNLVNGSAVNIEGALNSVLNGKIGGNVYFLDPFGVVVGKTGTVNVGSFTAMTPTDAFQRGFFSLNGTPTSAATVSVFTGSVPISPKGLISVQGRVYAQRDISLIGQTVDNAGTVASGAVFRAVRPDFSDVVNVAGLSRGSTIVRENGAIVIRAVGDIDNSGTLLTDGSANLGAGNISLQANGNLAVDAGSLISASGVGGNSNGGQIELKAAGNSSIQPNSVVSAVGGASGNGGTIDLSAGGTLDYSGGVLKAGAVNGVAGRVTIDPTDLNITGNIAPNDGTSVTLTGDTITVAPGVVISTRQIGAGSNLLTSPSTGNSGNISLTSNSTTETAAITIGNGAALLAEGTGRYASGDISLTATRSDAEAAASAGAQITIGNAIVLGRNVTISATSTATANSSANSAVAAVLNNTDLGFLFGGPVQLYSSGATSSIIIGDPTTAGSATVAAGGNLAIGATATSSTTSSVSGSSGFAYGQSDAAATVKVAGNAFVSATGNIALNSTVSNTLSVRESTKQQAQAVVDVAFGEASSGSTVQIDGSVAGVGTVSINASNTNNFKTTAGGSDYGTTSGGAGSAAVALGFYQSSALTNVTGTVNSNSAGVQIGANSVDTQDSVSSSSSVPSEGFKATALSYLAPLQNIGSVLTGATSLGSAPGVSASSGASSLGIAAAVSVAESSNQASVDVTGTVNAHGATAVNANAADLPQISATGSVSGQQQDLGGAAAVSSFTNEANALVYGSASMNSGGAMAISATAVDTNPVLNFPNNFPAQNFSGTSWAGTLGGDIHTVLNAILNPGVITTSFVNTGISTSGSGSGGFGIAGAVNLIGLTNEATASVTGAAHLSAAGNLNVSAVATAEAVNVAGEAFGVGALATGNPGVAAGTSVGGSYDGENLSNTSQAFIGSGTTVSSGANIAVAANTQTLDIGVAQAGDKATQYGITGAFNDLYLNDTASAYIANDAVVTATQAVGVNAGNTLLEASAGGALGTGGTAQVGAAVNWNQLHQTTLAYIGDPGNAASSACTGCAVTAGTGVSVNATSSESLYALTLAATSAPGYQQEGAGTSGIGVSGEVSLNQVGSSGNPGIVTKAFINDATTVKGGKGAVTVNASDSSFVVGASLVDTLGPTVSLSGAYAENDIVKDVEATTTNTVLQGTALNVTAASGNDLYAVTEGGAVSTESGGALVGAVNRNLLSNTVNAAIGNGTTASSIGAGGVLVSAAEGLGGGDQVVSVAGGLGASSGIGLGESLDFSTLGNTVTSSIGAATVTTPGNVQVLAATNVGFVPVSVSAGAGNLGSGGSVLNETITDDTASSVGGAVKTTSNLLIAAADSSSATLVSGGLGLGGSLGVGSAAAAPQMTRTTTAAIAGGAVVSAAGADASAISYDGRIVAGLLVDAKTTGGLTQYVASGGVGDVGVAAASVLPGKTLTDDTEATVGAGATVNGSSGATAADQSVSVLASDHSTLQDFVGMLALGGDFGASAGADNIAASWTVNAAVGAGATVHAANNVVIFGNLQNGISSETLSGSASGLAAASGAVSIVNESSNVSSTIAGSVTAGGTVALDAERLTAGIDTEVGNLAIGAGLGAGFGASLSMVTATDRVIADVMSGANVQASGKSAAVVPSFVNTDGSISSAAQTGVAVLALSSNAVSASAMGGAGSGVVGAQGSVPVNTVNETTIAGVDSGAGVNKSNSGAKPGQNVQVSALDNTNVTSAAGSVSAGGVALSGAVDTDNVTRDVVAYINAATVNAANNILLQSGELGKINSTADAGAFGGASVAGSVSNVSDDTSVTANATGGSTLAAGNAVSVVAFRSTSLSASDGSAVVSGLAGVNGSVANLTQLDVTLASVGPATSVSALGENGGGLTVSALGTENNSASVVGGALSGVAAVSGSLTRANYTENTSASIGNGALINQANQNAGTAQSVSVNAIDNSTLSSSDGAIAASLVGVGIGLGVDIENVQKTTTASIGDAAKVTAKGALSVASTSTESVSSLTGSAGLGLAGFAGTLTNYQTSPIAPTTQASIGASTLSAGSIGVRASDALNANVLAGVLSAGGVAFGAATDEVTSAAVTSAAVASGASLSSAGNIGVSSTYSDNLQGAAYAGSGGVVAGDAALTSLADQGQVTAALAGTVSRAQNVTVAANATRSVSGGSAGLSVGGIAAGASIDTVSIVGSDSATAGGIIGTANGGVQSLSIAATNSEAATSNAAALSAGIGASTSNSASADLGGTVAATLAGGSKVTLAGASGLSIAASSIDASSASTQGGNFGAAVAVGLDNSEASSTPVVTAAILDNTALSAPAMTVAANYQSNGISANSVMSSGSLVNVSAASTSTASSTDSPTVSAVIGDAVNTASALNGGVVSVTSTSSTSASANFNGENFGGVVVPGNSAASANIGGYNAVLVGSNVALSGSAVTLAAFSSNTLPQVQTSGTTGGILGVLGTNAASGCIDACATTARGAGTLVIVGAGSSLNAGTGAILLRAQSQDSATNVAAQGTAGGVAIESNTNVATLSITDDPTVTITNATLTGGTATIVSNVTGLRANAYSDSVTEALGSSSTSDSTLTATSDPAVNISGTTITAPASLVIAAIVPNNLPGLAALVNTTNQASADIQGATGSITANAINLTTFDPKISVDAATSLTTRNLSVDAVAPQPLSPTDTSNSYYSNAATAKNETAVVEVGEVVESAGNDIFGWIPGIGSYIVDGIDYTVQYVEQVLNSTTSNNLGNSAYASTPSIVLNGKLTQPGGAVATLTANPGVGGNASFSGNGFFTATNDGHGDIVVNSLTNSGESINVQAPNGTVSGHLAITRVNGYGNINITNNTTENLVVNSLAPTASDGSSPDVTVRAGDFSGFTSTVQSSGAPTAISIIDNSSGNVVLQGPITASFGSVNVKDTGGSILSTSGASIEANVVSLSAGGSIGSGASPVNVRLIDDPNPTPATLSASAGQDVNLAVAGIGYEASVLPAGTVLAAPTINSITAGGALSLSLAPPAAYVLQDDRTLVPEPLIFSGYTFGTLKAGGSLAISDAGGYLNSGNLASTNGSVSVTVAQGDLETHSISAPNGAVTLTASGGIVPFSGTISGATVNLSAGTSVGIAQAPEVVAVSGSLNASAGTGVYLKDTTGALTLGSISTSSGNVGIADSAGNINLGSITATPGSITLAAPQGSLLSTGSAVNLTGSAVSLTAKGTAGVIGAPLTLSATGPVTVTAASVDLTAASGDLDISTVTSSGNVILSSATGNIDLGTVTSNSGYAAIIANQSIVNASAPCTGCANVSAANISLNATNGAIGSQSAPVFVNNHNPSTGVAGSGQLSAQANGGVYVTEVQGNLLSPLLSSATGNIQIAVLNGDANLAEILGTQSVIVAVSGNTLDVGTIGPPPGSTQSPTQVVLTENAVP